MWHLNLKQKCSFTFNRTYFCIWKVLNGNVTTFFFDRLDLASSQNKQTNSNTHTHTIVLSHGHICFDSWCMHSCKWDASTSAFICSDLLFFFVFVFRSVCMCVWVFSISNATFPHIYHIGMCSMMLDASQCKRIPNRQTHARTHIYNLHKRSFDVEENMFTMADTGQRGKRWEKREHKQQKSEVQINANKFEWPMYS